MRVDAEKDGVARLASDHDDRITPVGRVIRAMETGRYAGRKSDGKKGAEREECATSARPDGSMEVVKLVWWEGHAERAISRDFVGGVAELFAAEWECVFLKR